MIKSMTVIFALLTISMNGNAQAQTDPESVEVTDMLTYKQFDEIRTFILDKGDAKSYCRMYDDNPHYRLEKFDLYLNPIMQFPDGKSINNKETYKTLVLASPLDKENEEDEYFGKKYPIIYTFIMCDSEKKKVYMKPYWDTEEPVTSRVIKLKLILGEVVSEILR